MEIRNLQITCTVNNNHLGNFYVNEIEFIKSKENIGYHILLKQDCNIVFACLCDSYEYLDRYDETVLKNQVKILNIFME